MRLENDHGKGPSKMNDLFSPSLQDDLFTASKEANIRHVLVFRRGHAHVVNVIDRDGNPCQPIDIYRRLKYICDTTTETCQHPVGALTTLDRDKWADLRRMLQFGWSWWWSVFFSRDNMELIVRLGPLYETPNRGAISKFLRRQKNLYF